MINCIFILGGFLIEQFLKKVIYLFKKRKGKFFEVRLMKEAEGFLESLDENTKEKVSFNIRKTMQGLKGEWFEKMKGTMNYLNSEHFITNKH